MRESSLDFSTHLHNGDPLEDRTVHIPKGRPFRGNPPFTWQASAIDALEEYKARSWDLEHILDMLEEYNGLGYRNMGVSSPYLWSFTDQYKNGKYVADGEYDPYAVDQQCGCAAVLKVLESQGTIKIDGSEAEYPPSSEPAEGVPAPIKRQVLVVGMKGDWVRCAQDLLRGCGYQVTVDGDFGPNTENAIILFQRNLGLVADGEVGPKTWAALDNHSKFPGYVAQYPGNNTIVKPSASGINARLIAFYNNQDNYNKVYEDVMRTFGTTHNACVAFMSSALRMIGVPVPHGPGTNGDDISLVTLPFSDWLALQGWQKITDPEQLQPGDVCLTIDDPHYPGYPAHVYCFVCWQDKEEGTGLVIDNQSFTHARNIFGYADFNFSPIKFAMRASLP